MSDATTTTGLQLRSLITQERRARTVAGRGRDSRARPGPGRGQGRGDADQSRRTSACCSARPTWRRPSPPAAATASRSRPRCRRPPCPSSPRGSTRPMPVGNEGAGTVIKAGSSEAAQALLGKTVSMVGGSMYAQYRLLKATRLPAAAGRHDGGRGRLVVRQSADRARHDRDHEARGPQGAGAHRGRLEPRPDAEQDLPGGRHRPGQHRAQRRAGQAPARHRRQARRRFDARRASPTT